MSEINATTFSSHAARAKGAMFFAVFGAAWLTLWNQRGMHSNWLVYLVIAVLALALAGLAVQRHQQYKAHAEEDSPAAQRAGRLFHFINAAQWIIILVVGNVLTNMGLADWVIPFAMLVVGLHFLPLAKLFNTPGHFWFGLVMSLFAITYPFVFSQGAADPYGCLGAGLMLWGYALLKLMGIPAMQNMSVV
ncbi:MAG: hypothetical protein HYR68_09315 [Burkholderiales bacterium]|nr:hypothetical protein [Burkholderiales bacterium]MBI3730002.1 hypothetical protein [Burkholderiales bacterium]